MSRGAVEIDRAGPRTLRIAIKAAGVAAASAVGALAVWFAGFDWLWAIATVLGVASVGAAFATLQFEDAPTWQPSGREPPRGIGLTFPMLKESLAACDRLARPPITRPIRVLLTNEREDRLARGAMLRQLRALLVAELRARGIAGAHQTERAAMALLGPDALAILQPSDAAPITSAAIARCLHAVERLHNNIPSP